MAAEYDEICRVAATPDGIPVSLILQKRLDIHPEPYYCLSWRTRYQSVPTKSRRFYSSREHGFWKLRVETALYLMRKASDKGMLDSRFDDDKHLRDGGLLCRGGIDSRKITECDRRNEAAAIICQTGDHEWGTDPVFVIRHSETGRGSWREIMLIDTERKYCTFRCTTTIPDYKMGIYADRLASSWRLDNAMQDASTASMREFLTVLEELVAEECRN